MIKCPVCGQYEFENDNDFDSCNTCLWQNDGVQLDDPDYWGGANDLSLNDYKAAWLKHGIIDNPTHLPIYVAKAV